MKPLQSFQAQRGFSLVELMVAMTLGLLLTFGVLTFFQDALQSSRTAISSSALQDVAQVALENIKRDVRMSGFRGQCVPPGTAPVDNSAINTLYSVLGQEGAGTSSDLLRTYTANIQGDDLFLWDYNPTTQELQVCANEKDGSSSCQAAEFATDDLLLLSDCQSWAVFNPSKASTTDAPQTRIKVATNSDGKAPSLQDFLLPGTDPSETDSTIKSGADNSVVLFKLGKSGTEGATEYQIIADSNPQHELRSGDQPSILFRNNEPLVYGVENLQVLYGRSTAGSIRYDTGCSADDLANPDTCAALLAGTTHLRISLVVHSDQRSEANLARTFNIANPDGSNRYNAPADGRLRQVYTTTIQLRNTL